MARLALPLLCLVLCLAIGLGAGCAPLKQGDAPTKDCFVPEDQRATLMSRWPSLPVPLAAGPGWSDEETAELAAAAGTWNRFYEASLGLQVFDTGTEGKFRRTGAARPSSSALCQQSLVQGNRFVSSVVIHRRESWSDAPSAIAITRACYGAAKPVPRNFMALLDVNFEDFFVAGRKLPDLETIMLHELGHLLGLDHSCDMAAGKPSFPWCKGEGLPVAYYSAAMFPQVFFDSITGIGEEKRELNGNDQSRGNCLYQGFSSK